MNNEKGCRANVMHDLIEQQPSSSSITISNMNNTSAHHQESRMFYVKKKLKSIYLNWSRHVDINGYNKIFEYKHNFKIQLIWILILLASTGATFYIISKNITGFLNFDSVSQINLVNEVPAIFPTITICNNDPFTTRQAENVYDEVLNQTGYNLTSINQIDTNLNNLVLMHVSNPNYGDENRKRLGFNKSMIYSCKYKKKSCQKDLHWYWSYTYGNCWQFNSGFNFTNDKIDIKNSTIEGRDDGLSLTLFPLINENQYMTTWDNGMIVFIHNYQYKPLLTDAVYIELGKTSFVSIKRTITHKYPAPYSDCIDLDTYSSHLYLFIKDSGQVYRQKDCFKLCQQEQIIEKCGCYSVEFPQLNNLTKPCLNLLQFSCVDEQKSNFDLTVCQTNSCPLECDSIKYDLSLSTLQNPGYKEYFTLADKDILSYSQMLGRNLTFDLFQTMWVTLKVFYPSLEYTEITETPQTTIFDLFTQIGGSLGLFISFSVFTLFELTEILILILHALLKPRASQKYSIDKSEVSKSK
jgi:hypothetical protein